jgi:hypothetical protein
VHLGGSRDAARSDRWGAARSLAAARCERWAVVVSKRLAVARRERWGTTVSRRAARVVPQGCRVDGADGDTAADW